MKTKPRFYKLIVPIYVRLDHETSDPVVTLNSALQGMEDQIGNVFADTSLITWVQVKKKDAPEELK